MTGTTSTRSRLFWPLAVAGWLVMAFAVRGILTQHRQTNPPALVTLLVGLDVVHDLVLAPVVLLVGVGVARLVPARLRPPVTAALVVTAVVALYATPFVLGYGRSAAAGPSRLPNNYAWGLAEVVGVVWGLTALAVLVRTVRGARR